MRLPKVEVGSGPPVVIVTVFDPKADASWVQQIKKNREDYAKKHGASTHVLADVNLLADPLQAI